MVVRAVHGAGEVAVLIARPIRPSCRPISMAILGVGTPAVAQRTAHATHIAIEPTPRSPTLVMPSTTWRCISRRLAIAALAAY